MKSRLRQGGGHGLSRALPRNTRRVEQLLEAFGVRVERSVKVFGVRVERSLEVFGVRVERFLEVFGVQSVGVQLVRVEGPACRTCSV